MFNKLGFFDQYNFRMLKLYKIRDAKIDTVSSGQSSICFLCTTLGMRHLVVLSPSQDLVLISITKTKCAVSLVITTK
jgi:hypothetical protein